MKMLNWAHFTVLVAALIVVPKVMAEPPVVHQSTEPGTPAVLGENTAKNGAGVFGRANAEGAIGVRGQSDAARGIYGESKTGQGVWGFSESSGGVVGQSNQSEGVQGVSHDAAGVLGRSDNWNGVFGTTKSSQAAGGEFQNTGGGDLIRAGQAGVFRVLNNGDVLIRGQKIGVTGPQGPQGPAGPPGPATHTSAVCVGPGGSQCSCSNKTISFALSDCTVTSDTGTCTATSSGTPGNIFHGSCCVCAP